MDGGLAADSGISMGAAVFAGLTRVVDRQTDSQTDRQTTLLGG